MYPTERIYHLQMSCQARAGKSCCPWSFIYREVKMSTLFVFGGVLKTRPFSEMSSRISPVGCRGSQSLLVFVRGRIRKWKTNSQQQPLTAMASLTALNQKGVILKKS